MTVSGNTNRLSWILIIGRLCPISPHSSRPQSGIWRRLLKRIKIRRIVHIMQEPGRWRGFSPGFGARLSALPSGAGRAQAWQKWRLRLIMVTGIHTGPPRMAHPAPVRCGCHSVTVIHGESWPEGDERNQIFILLRSNGHFAQVCAGLWSICRGMWGICPDSMAGGQIGSINAPGAGLPGPISPPACGAGCRPPLHPSREGYPQGVAEKRAGLVYSIIIYTTHPCGRQ